MTTQDNRSNSKTHESTDQVREWEEKSLFIGYLKSIGDPDSLWLLPETEGELWAMRCPLKGPDRQLDDRTSVAGAKVGLRLSASSGRS